MTASAFTLLPCQIQDAILFSLFPGTFTADGIRAHASLSASCTLKSDVYAVSDCRTPTGFDKPGECSALASLAVGAVQAFQLRVPEPGLLGAVTSSAG